MRLNWGIIIALILCILFWVLMFKCFAQPRTLDDLVEFRADGVYAKETWIMKAPFWPQYKITKGTRILTIENE